MNLLKLLMGRGCAHRFSWPRIDDAGNHYQVCPDCGAAYRYDWKTMRRTEHLLAEPSTRSTRSAAVPPRPWQA